MVGLAKPRPTLQESIPPTGTNQALVESLLHGKLRFFLADEGEVETVRVVPIGDLEQHGVDALFELHGDLVLFGYSGSCVPTDEHRVAIDPQPRAIIRAY
jgi:hypothetical protein